MGGIVGGVERMEFRGEQVQLVKKQEEEEEKQVLAALSLFEGIIADQCRKKLKENQDANRITEMAILKINESDKINELCRVIAKCRKRRKKRM